MIPKECKRLAEVDFPIARVSVFARAEKDSRIAHIPRLHVWPAARPGGACRSMILACLLPDPCDPLCPPDFLSKARSSIAPLYPAKSSVRDLRDSLLQFVGDFSNWDNAHARVYFQVAEQLVMAAHDEPPVLVDPFAGGGAIPLEGLRLGCDVVSSDLNPVACLINQVVLNDIPRYRDDMVESLETIARGIKAKAEHELKSLYPAEASGSTPVAFLWARTVECEEPNCGCEIPLIRSFWLSQKTDRRIALRIVVDRTGKRPLCKFEIFKPTTDSQVSGPLVSRANATCPACKRVLASERVKRQLCSQRGGAWVRFAKGRSAARIGGARLLAVATVTSDSTERQYRLPTPSDYTIVHAAQEEAAKLLLTRENDISVLPDEPTPVGGGRGAGRAFSVHAYGMTRWADVFTARQLLAVSCLCRCIASEVPDHLKALTALLISKVVDMNNSLTEWRATGERPAHMLSRWALPMKWDFPEAVPLSEASGSLDSALARTMHLLRAFAVKKTANSVSQSDCVRQLLPDESVSIWCTDPPYYDAIPYSDLSDFFFVWLKRALPGHPL